MSPLINNLFARVYVFCRLFAGRLAACCARERSSLQQWQEVEEPSVLFEQQVVDRVVGASERHVRVNGYLQSYRYFNTYVSFERVTTL